MSKLSIYENSWINLVFEGKNKDYGAYQLRQQSDRMTAIAFFSGLILISGMACIYLLSNLLGVSQAQVIPQVLDQIIQVNYTPPPKQQKPQPVIPMTKKEQQPKEDVPLKDPVITKPEDANQNVAQNKDITNTTTTTPATGVTTTITPTSGTGTITVPPIVENTDIVIAATLDKLPEFPGGIEKFYTYVGRNFVNPESDENKTLKVYVSFVIEKDGSMTDIQVKRDPGYGLGKEAIRVLKSLKTKWVPGVLNGKPVRTAYNLPITVQIQ